MSLPGSPIWRPTFSKIWRPTFTACINSSLFPDFQQIHFNYGIMEANKLTERAYAGF